MYESLAEHKPEPGVLPRVDVAKHRTLYFVPEHILSPDSATALTEPEQAEHREKVETLEEATLVGSLANMNFGRQMHYPAIDIDHPAMVVESSPGKSHLYIEKAMTWEQYTVLLQAMVYAGIVERGYLDASINRGQTFLRKPGLGKERKS
jgi:hypothetical protein